MIQQYAPYSDVGGVLVHNSAIFYIANVSVGSAGYTWYLNDSAHRVVYNNNEIKNVQYKHKIYELQDSSTLKSFVKINLDAEHTVQVGGKSFYSRDQLDELQCFPFIDISSPTEQQDMRKIDFYWKDKLKQ